MIVKVTDFGSMWNHLQSLGDQRCHRGSNSKNGLQRMDENLIKWGGMTDKAEYEN